MAETLRDRLRRHPTLEDLDPYQLDQLELIIADERRDAAATALRRAAGNSHCYADETMLSEEVDRG